VVIIHGEGQAWLQRKGIHRIHHGIGVNSLAYGNEMWIAAITEQG
jgi:hypothetical protein